MAEVSVDEMKTAKKVIRILVVLVVLLALSAGYLWAQDKKRRQNERQGIEVEVSMITRQLGTGT